MPSRNLPIPNINATAAVIERMNPTEADAVSGIFAQIVTELPYYNAEAKASEIAQHSPAALRKYVTRDPDSVLIARTQGIVGFCVSHFDDGLIWLAWFGVQHAYRKCGIASALLNALEQTVPRRRCHKIWCDSRTNNDPSINILSRQCFSQICTIRNHWYGQDFILWEKLIG